MFSDRHKHAWNVVIVTSLIAFAVGCVPQVKRFRADIPVNATVSGLDDKPGPIHACPGTKIRLSWEAKGKVSLAATEGKIFQLPACYSAKVSSKGQEILLTEPEIAGACGHTAIFRLVASHNFLYRRGYCPLDRNGPGCPGAEREIDIEPQTDESLAERVNGCTGDSVVVSVLRQSMNWDERYHVASVSIPPRIASYLGSSGTTITVSHAGKDATFSATETLSTAFNGQQMAGTWNMKLSACPKMLPPALVITVRAECGQ